MRVRHINTGRAVQRAIGQRTVLTAIGKSPVSEAVSVRTLGIVGDQQADLSVHGGPSKAVYAYPLEHYAFWKTVRAQAGVAGPGDPLPPGSLGENLTLEGLLESQVWIGDRLRFADCTLAVSEPRHPCFKFNAAMGFPQASSLMTQSGWCGWYLAVHEPGTLRPGEPFELLAGPREVSISELFKARSAARRSGGRSAK